MTRTVKTTKTAEERKAQAEALQAGIAAKVEQLRDSDAWRNFLDFAQSFHSYSLNNLLLIWSQNEDATRVAGFRAWQERGRQVRKGEKALRIFGYSTKKITETNNETGEDEEKKIPIFPILSVFDISQTDLIEGAEDHSTVAHRLTGEDQAQIFGAVVDWLSGQGWDVQREELRAGINGYTDPEGKRALQN